MYNEVETGHSLLSANACVICSQKFRYSGSQQLRK